MRIRCTIGPAFVAALLALWGCGGGGEAPSGSTSSSSSASSSSGSGGSGGAAPAVCPEGVAIGDYAGKITVDVMIDGTGPHSFIVDTGAPTSAIAKSVGSSGMHEVTVAGRSRTVNLPSNWTTVGGQTGILGTDFLGAFALSVDYARQRLWLDDTIDEASLRACDHVEGDPATVAYTTHDYLMVPGSLEGVSGTFLLDTGASLGLVPDAMFDSLSTAHPRPALDGFYTPAAAGTFWSRLSTLGTMEVGGKKVDHITTRTAPQTFFTGLDVPAGTTMLGFVPSGFLRHFLVTVDYPKETLRLDGYKGDTFVEPAFGYFAGISLERALSPIHVTAVLDGSSAEEQGIQIGDEVSAIGGAPVSSIPAANRAWSLASPAPSKITVTIVRDGMPMDLQLDTRDLLMGP
ncbi:Hypothetical protein A7982_04898 [Minicystis rosea]|nr:Hypothetical protein A7982_04898 [Minicystis rosea]